MEIFKVNGYPYATVYKMAKSEIEKIDFALCNQPKETLENYYKRQERKPDLLCNGGFFALSTGETTFTYIDEGSIISIDANYLEGFGIKNGNDLVLAKYQGNFNDFISAYPVLIKDGKPVTTSIGSELNYNARRTILGYDNNYIYVIAVESPGYNFATLKKILVGLNIPTAINLDGGGSTRVLYNGKRVTDTEYSRAVDNIVAFYFKQEPKILYRVQTGAFSKKENAENFRKRIAVLNDSINAGYKNAYIRLINGLYKVQVGAFSKKENAQKVVNHLKGYGIDSFITTK